MKRLLLAILLSIAVEDAFTQPTHTDSLQKVAADSSDPFVHFDIIRSRLEQVDARQTNDADSASCIQLLKIAQELRNDSLLAIAYNWIGSYFAFTKGDHVTGFEYYFKAIPLAEKVRDKRRISSLYFDIAIVYGSLGNPEESFRNNLKGGENLPDPSSPIYDFMLAQYQRNLGFYYLAKNQADSALHYGQAVAESANRVKSNNFLASGLILNGAAYAQKNDTAMADLFFKRAYATSQTVYMSSLKGTFFSNYIQFLLNTRRIKEAKGMAVQFMRLGAESHNNVIRLAAAGCMQQAFDSLHQTDSAYFYARLKEKISAEIFSQNNVNKIQALAFNEQVRNIEKEAKEKRAEEQRRQNIQYVLIALGIIMFVILFLLLSRTIIVDEKLISFFTILGLLVVFEFINLLIHPWLAHITHESPILMLLAMVAIASLLIPMHHRLEHWIKEKMIEKNKAIRLAAAKKTIKELEKEKPDAIQD